MQLDKHNTEVIRKEREQMGTRYRKKSGGGEGRCGGSRTCSAALISSWHAFCLEPLLMLLAFFMKLPKLLFFVCVSTQWSSAFNVVPLELLLAGAEPAPPLELHVAMAGHHGRHHDRHRGRNLFYWKSVGWNGRRKERSTFYKVPIFIWMLTLEKNS